MGVAAGRRGYARRLQKFRQIASETGPGRIFSAIAMRQYNARPPPDRGIQTSRAKRRNSLGYIGNAAGPCV